MWRNGPFFPRDTWFVPSPHDRISSVILMYTLEYRSQRKKRTEATVNANLEHLTDTTTTAAVNHVPQLFSGIPDDDGHSGMDLPPEISSGYWPNWIRHLTTDQETAGQCAETFASSSSSSSSPISRHLAPSGRALLGALAGGPPAQRRTQLTAPLGFRRHAALPAPGDAAAGALLEAALTAQRGPWLASALVPVAVDDLAAARAGRPAHAPGGGCAVCKDIELILRRDM
ncbi:hypothetical protein PAPYR_13229 [Paratrimastix pyriformis]|uniref:Uncharacterized protein n=1 Tax=Paratrimastix pyriformis TaxID=342808 RepID=A0ABQ8U0K5_9EUKA|nr:hypothetical protein PAPYR_13229 [Paratrimastix pyriformis]